MKWTILLSLLITVFIIASCDKNDSGNGKSLKGTQWTSSSGTEVYTMSFVSDTEVQVYTTDISGNPKYRIVTASYSFNGSSVKFPNYANMFVGSVMVHKYHNATISGNVMKATYTPEYLGVTLSDGTTQFLKK